MSMSILSNDPQAIEKLQRQLAACEGAQERMKKINAAYHKAGWDGVKALGLVDEETLRQLQSNLERYPYYKQPFASYELTNNNANIKRIRGRIDEIGRRTKIEDSSQEYKGFKLVIDTEENRVMFIFPDKPAEDARNMMKRSGFKWSPTRGAWVRLLSENAISSAEWIAKEIERKTEAATEPKPFFRES